jgi:hypothetical protein
MSALRARLSRIPGFVPLTPQDSQGPILAYGIKDAEMRFRDRLLANRVQISLYPNGVRISRPIHNNLENIGRLIAILTADAPGTR